MKKIIYITIVLNLFFAGNIFSQVDSTAKYDTNAKVKNIKVEYALLIADVNQVVVIYENGNKEDLLKKFNLSRSQSSKLKLDWDLEETFPLRVKMFKYLNEQGFILVSHAYNSERSQYSYIFRKDK